MIVDSLRSQCPPDFCILADFPDSTYDFPASAASTDLRPDLVVWSNSERVMVLAELTVCFETKFADAHQRKSAKYYDLLETCAANGYATSLVMIHCKNVMVISTLSQLHLFRGFHSTPHHAVLSGLKWPLYFLSWLPQLHLFRGFYCSPHHAVHLFRGFYSNPHHAA